MNYTEEEFFGNKQYKATEEDQMEPKEHSELEKTETVDIGGTVFKTFLKTIMVLICSVFYCVSVMITLMPKTAIKFFDFLGAEQASLVCYEKIYKNSGTLADLYNLVQKSIQAKDYKKTTEYINELKGKNGYSEFCKEVNAASIEITENKYIAYVGDLDSYLISQHIIALYEEGRKDAAEEAAIEDLINGENLYSFGLSAYIECVFSDSQLTSSEKNNILLGLYNKSVGNQSETKEICTYIDEKRALVDYSNAADDTVDKILRVYTSLKIENFKLKYYECANDENKAGEIRLIIEELQDVYNDLIK